MVAYLLTRTVPATGSTNQSAADGTGRERRWATEEYERWLAPMLTCPPDRIVEAKPGHHSPA
jgi:hypothetical protein